MNHIKAFAYTDGSCGGNPGPMGWAALVIMLEAENDWASKNYIRLVANHNPMEDGTNNRAELMGIIEALKMIKPFYREGCEITIYTDSNWAKNSLDGTYKKVKKNLDLLSEAAGLMAEYSVCSLRHVEGHTGDKYNEIVDNYAVSARTTGKGFDLNPPHIVGLRP